MSKLEDKYTRVANNILDAMMKTRFSPSQYRIIHAVWRHTYGYQRKDHEFGLAFLEELTELDPRQIRRDVKSLIDACVLIVTQQPTNKLPRKIGFNKYTNRWQIDGSVKKVERTGLPPQEILGEDTDTHSREDRSTHSGEDTSTPHIKKDLKKDLKEIINSRFNEFWSFYPKRVGKKDALRHFERLHKDKHFSFDDFILGTKNYVTYCKTAKRFYKDASSFVNQETYKDFLDMPEVPEQHHQLPPASSQSKSDRNRQLLQEMMEEAQDEQGSDGSVTFTGNHSLPERGTE